MNSMSLTNTTARPSTAPSTVEQLVPTASPQMRMLVDRHHRAIVWKGNVPTLMAAVPEDTRDALKQRLGQIRKALAPINSHAERDRLAGALVQMFAGYTNVGGVSANPRGTVAAYVSALSDLPLWAVMQAIDDVNRGRVAGLSPDFPPNAPRLFQIAEIHASDLKAEKVRVEAVLNAKIEDQRERDPAVVERIAKGLRECADRIGGDEQRIADAKRAEQAAERLKQKLAAGDEAILREYRMHGIQPVLVNGRPMSLSLARTTGAKLFKMNRPAPEPRCEFTPPPTEEDDHG